jgi:hypothetical protein
MRTKYLLMACLLLALPLAAPAQQDIPTQQDVSAEPDATARPGASPQPGASGQPAPDLDLEVEQFTLPNGLRVFVHRAPGAPLISTNIWYHVGSAHERRDRTGFAHLFEHIMFEGSANVPRGRIDIWFEEVGGSPNGTTSRDRTNYMQTFASHALDMALFIESDRMGLLLPAMRLPGEELLGDPPQHGRRQRLEEPQPVPLVPRQPRRRPQQRPEIRQVTRAHDSSPERGRVPLPMEGT